MLEVCWHGCTAAGLMSWVRSARVARDQASVTIPTMRALLLLGDIRASALTEDGRGRKSFTVNVSVTSETSSSTRLVLS
jgi:hypothetical protein